MDIKDTRRVFDLTNVESYFFNSEKFRKILENKTIEDKLENIKIRTKIENINFYINETTYFGQIFLYNYNIGRYLIGLDFKEKKMTWKHFYPYNFLDYYDKKYLQRNFNYFGTLIHYLVLGFSLSKIINKDNFSEKELFTWYSHHYPFFISSDRVKHLKSVVYDRIPSYKNYIYKRNENFGFLDDVPLLLEYKIVKDYLKERGIPLEYLNIDFLNEIKLKLR